MPKNEEPFREEVWQLSKSALEIDRQLKKLQSIPRYQGTDVNEQAIDNIREKERQNLKKATDEPYFGRLDFQEDGKDEAKSLYIGKAAVFDESTGDPMIVDWRAPVSSMFYSFSGVDDYAYYESPDGLIDGTVDLKRNIVIRQQTLQRVVDSYVKGDDNIPVADEFLLYRLGENKDNRLKDIVTTIQSEQNDIIRSPKNTPLIIQGVAGSGKTTVALHRLAYLIYEYRKNILAEKMIIFAPNSMFLDYISNVLPELGVGDIQQTTFNEWSLNRLNREVKLKDPSKKLQEWFLVESKHLKTLTDDSSERIKGSIHFKDMIDSCLHRYEQSVLPEKNFEPWENSTLEVEKIHYWYNVDFKGYPLLPRRELVVNRIKQWLDKKVKEIPERHLRTEMKKKANERLRTYLKTWPKPTALDFYHNIFTNMNIDRGNIPIRIVQSTVQNIENKQVEQEDLAPLVYIHNQLNGIDKEHKFHHVVIDEAQDFSPFQVSLLKDLAVGDSFTILGDLSQGIHDYMGVHSWEEILKIFDKRSPKYYELEQSYRSTMEIIYFANEVLSSNTRPVSVAKPVFRSGEKPKIVEVAAEEQNHAIINVIQKLQSDGINSIAVIGRAEKACSDIHKILKESGLSAHLIDLKQQEYDGGISVIPIYLTKGLEFDVAILFDVDIDNYKENERDAKLLYVGCTRALHDLWLFHSQERSRLIQKVEPEFFTHNSFEQDDHLEQEG